MSRLQSSSLLRTTPESGGPERPETVIDPPAEPTAIRSEPGHLGSPDPPFDSAAGCPESAIRTLALRSSRHAPLPSPVIASAHTAADVHRLVGRVASLGDSAEGIFGAAARTVGSCWWTASMTWVACRASERWAVRRRSLFFAGGGRLWPGRCW